MTKILHILDHGLPIHSGYSFRTRAILKAQIANGLDVASITGLRHNLALHEKNGAPVVSDMDEHNITKNMTKKGRWDNSLLSKVEIVDGLKFFRTNGLPSKLPIIREWDEVRRFSNQIVQCAKLWNPDILHAHSPALNGLAALYASRELNIPFLYEIRAFWEDAAVGNGSRQEGDIMYRVIRSLENHVVKHAGHIVTICAGLRDDLVERGVAEDKIMISPNGVDLDLFDDPPPRDTQLATQLGLGEDKVLGFVGSFYDYEGLDILIRAMPEIVKRINNIKLILVGGGICTQSLQDLSHQLHMADKIIFTGRVPHKEVEKYYSLIDIMVYPRKSMRLTELVTPLKPLEAMAQRRLVAASDIGGHRELIENGKTGILFDADDPMTLAQKIITLLEDGSRWPGMIDKAQKYVATERDWTKNVKHYTPIYHDLIQVSRFKDAA